MWSATANLVLWHCSTPHNFLFMNQYPDDSLLNQCFDEQLFLDLCNGGLRPRPPCATGFLELRYQVSTGSQLLGHLRHLTKLAQKGEIKREESYKTKAQLAELAFSQEWAAINSEPEFKCIGEIWLINQRRLLQKKLIDKTGESMRRVSKKSRDELKKCRSNKEKYLFIKNIEMFVRVDLTDNGELVYGYHGLDVRQSAEILRRNLEYTEMHSHKQDADRRFAKIVYELEARPLQTELPLKLDPDFKPQDDLDIFGKESNTSGDYGQ